MQGRKQQRGDLRRVERNRCSFRRQHSEKISNLCLEYSSISHSSFSRRSACPWKKRNNDNQIKRKNNKVVQLIRWSRTPTKILSPLLYFCQIQQRRIHLPQRRRPPLFVYNCRWRSRIRNFSLAKSYQNLLPSISRASETEKEGRNLRNDWNFV